jgi:hypothetical protein
MDLIDQLVERRVAEAQARGEFDDLPGQGQPLQLEDDAMVPEELRVAYRLLKNAGYLPPQLQLRHDIRQVEQLIRQAEAVEQKAALQRRLHALLLQLRMQQPDSRLLHEYDYLEKLNTRLQQP